MGKGGSKFKRSISEIKEVIIMGLTLKMLNKKNIER